MRSSSLHRCSEVVRLAVASLVTVLVVPAVPVAASSCWLRPVDAPVVDPFRAPTCPWCPGNRGIEFGTVAGTEVRSVAPGEVSFVGRVAGTAYLVVRLAGGERVTYGGVDARAGLGVGDRVAAGAVIGVTSPDASATDGRLHLGLRVHRVGPGGSDDVYADPEPRFGVLEGRRRLLPVDGSAPRPAPPPRLTCGVEPPD